MSCENTNARLQIKYTTIAGQEPTIPSTNDHNDGTWNPTDIYIGEFFLNATDELLWVRTLDGLLPVGGTGGSASFIGDFVSKANGGTYSGPVFAPTFSAINITSNTISATAIDANIFGSSGSVYYGDGSNLTGIVANWNGGTVSNASEFNNVVDFNDDISVNNIYSGVLGYTHIHSDVTVDGGLSASYFIGDGSLLTNLPMGPTANFYTTAAYLDGNIIRYDRTDLADAYSVDLTPILLTQSIASFDWNSTTNEATILINDGSFFTINLGIFNNISTAVINATEVYANNFYGIFNGTFSNDIYTTNASLSGTTAVFDRTDGVTYSLDLSTLVSSTQTLEQTLVVGNETGANDIVLSDTGSIYSSQITGPTANVFSAGYKFHDIGGWAPRIETSHNNNTNFIQVEDNDTYISNRQTNLPSIDNQGLITVSPVIVELRSDDLVTGDYGTIKVNDYQVQHQVYNSTTNNTSILTQSEYENIMTTSIAGITPSGDVMSTYVRTAGNTSQVSSGLNATNTTQNYSANIQAGYDGSHMQNFLTVTDGTETTGILQRHYEITVSGDIATFKGLQYLNDYSTNYNGLSLVDKNYVDYSIASGSLEKTLSLGNDSGTYDIIMGTATTIGTNGGTGRLLLDSLGDGDVVKMDASQGSRYARVVVDGYGEVNFMGQNGGTQSDMFINETGIQVSTSTGVGIEYSSDYSATFTNRSLVDKEYVDSMVVSAGATGATGPAGPTGPSGNGSGTSNYLRYPLLGQYAQTGQWGKALVDLTNYTSNGFVALTNRMYLQPFQEQTGLIIDTFAFTVSTAVVGSTVSIAIYNVATQSITRNSLTQITTVPGTYSVIGTISTATAGDKIITGINYTLPTTLNNTYYLGYISSNASNLRVWSTNVAVFPKWNTGVITGSIYYRGTNATFLSPTFSFRDNPTATLTPTQNTGGELLACVYTTK